MSNVNQTSYSSDVSENESLKREIFRYLKYWMWFPLSIIVSLIICYTYLRYTPKVYQSTSKIKILKKKDSGMDLSGLTGNSPLFDMSKINLENEIQILNSRRIIGKVVDNLNLTTYYYRSGRVIDNELFGNQIPFKVNWLNKYEVKSGISFNKTLIFSSIDKNSFKIKIRDSDYNKTFNFGQEIIIEDLKFVIHKNPLYQQNTDNDKNINFNYRSRETVINQLLGKIKAEPIGERSEVLEITLNGQNKSKNEAILNDLIDKFNQDGIEDDRRIAIKTEEFVSKRLDMLESELDTVETNLVNFKKSNDFTDMEAGTQVIFSTYSSAEQKNSELQNQLQIAKAIQDAIKNNAPYSYFPANVGLENSNTNSMIDNYNDLISKRNKLLTSSTQNSPIVQNLSKNLDLLNSNIQESINNYIDNLTITLNNIKSREQEFGGDIRAIPEKEKIARGIKRQQAVKENLYIFLLQKQVEADLSAAITANTAKVVDYAYSTSNPISPKPKIIYLAGLIIGFAFPVGVLYLLFLFDTKITSKEQIQDKLDIPIIAEIPLNKDYDNKAIKPSDNSDIAESFRILRTNLGFLDAAKNKDSKTKVFYSTSSTKGEGKTFVAINSAVVLSSSNHKTLLIGCDLRNPQLHNYLGISKNSLGLSSYLINPDLTLNDVLIKKIPDINFDVIISGEIPPNPSELLNNGRLKNLLVEAENNGYEYIIVDTAPTMLVTDTISIFEHADAIIYMIRTDFTELKILTHIKELQKQKKLNNFAIAINGVNTKRGYDYNYGYGYGYSEEKKSKKWYQF